MSTMLTIVIGFAAVYAAFSLIASWLQEMLATLFDLRSRNLIKGIENMLDDPTNVALVSQLKTKLLQQPSIAATVTKTRTAPSYLSAKQFSLAVTGLLQTGPAIATSAADAATQMISGINGLPASRLKSALSQIVQQASGDYNAAIVGIEKWYDDEMDRVSGWYRRFAQVWLFFIGIALAIAFNLDAVRLLHGFEQAPLLITPAQTSSGKSAMDIVPSVFQYPCIGWTRETASPTPPPRPTPPGSAKVAIKPIPRASAQHVQKVVPRGPSPTPTASPSPAPAETAAVVCGSISESNVLWAVGVLISAIALMLGAPFWFNVLGLFVNVRAAGDKPAKSEAASK